MTGAEIVHIAVTVAVLQGFCDVICNYGVYNKEPYQNSVSRLERAKWNKNKAASDMEKNPNKNTKRFERAETNYQECRSDVARRHTGPGLLTSMFFVMVLRILGAEYSGNVMAILPFVPVKLMSKITARGLDWQSVPESVFGPDSTIIPKQAASFMFVYFLCTLSVKYYVNKLIGTKAADGASGLMAVMESPRVKHKLRELGLDTEALKQD